MGRTNPLHFGDPKTRSVTDQKIRTVILDGAEVIYIRFIAPEPSCNDDNIK